MSSDGSVTSNESRIRQFGLYRTIDARTEEFLRSSRKRQIRQGCACAAISTAITVTVVVSVILVYEYSINAESNINKKVAAKPNWLALMNESDLAALDSKFHKKINFDKTTLKLLPILLKALNKNRYLEKIIDDYSSSSPPVGNHESSEETFKRNIFSDTKNWLKMPTSKLYTTDYKTSPLTYWKSPTQRLEYLTKIRKIRDYQRMLNYFDKMVNDKVGSNQRKEYEFTERTYIAETVPMKIERVKQMMPKKFPVENFRNAKEFAPSLKENISNCKCPKKLGQLISKLITGIQDMVPHMITKKLSVNRCENESLSTDESSLQTTVMTYKHTKPKTTKSSATVPIRRNNFGGFLQSLQRYTTKSTTYHRKQFITKKPVDMSNLRHFAGHTRRATTASTSSSSTSSTTPSTTSTSTTRRTTSKSSSTTHYTLPALHRGRTTTSTTTTTTTTTCCPETEPTITTTTEQNNFNNQNFDHITVTPFMAFTPILDKNNVDYDSLFKITETPNVESTNAAPRTRVTTEPFVPIRFVDNSKEGSANEKVMQPNTENPSYIRPTHLPVFREEDYDDYFGTTAKYTHDFENLDVHSLELIKTKMLSSSNVEFKPKNNLKKVTGQSKPPNFHPVIKQKDLDIFTMRKMTDMVYEDKTSQPEDKSIQEQLKEEPMRPIPSSKTPYQSYKNQVGPRMRTKITNFLETNTSITDTKISGIVKNSVKISSSEADQPGNNNDNIGEEDFQDEYAMKNGDASTISTPYPIYENTTRRITMQEMEQQELLNQWGLKPREEKALVKSTKSMLPSMRPIYLEIQRNSDWRQDDHNIQVNDYDANFNNNFFDLTNN